MNIEATLPESTHTKSAPHTPPKDAKTESQTQQGGSGGAPRAGVVVSSWPAVGTGLALTRWAAGLQQLCETDAQAAESEAREAGRCGPPPHGVVGWKVALLSQGCARSNSAALSRTYRRSSPASQSAPRTRGGRADWAVRQRARQQAACSTLRAPFSTHPLAMAGDVWFSRCMSSFAG